MQGLKETRVRSPGQEDLLEKGMATCSSILAWGVPWTEEPGGLRSMGWQRIGRGLVTDQQRNEQQAAFFIHAGLL